MIGAFLLGCNRDLLKPRGIFAPPVGQNLGKAYAEAKRMAMNKGAPYGRMPRVRVTTIAFPFSLASREHNLRADVCQRQFVVEPNESRNPERVEVCIKQRDAERGRVRQSPWTVRASRRLRGQVCSHIPSA